MKGEKVAVVGLGRSNLPLIRFLISKGARVTAFDVKTREALGGTYDELAALGVEFSLGPAYLEKLRGYRTIYVTPGMRKDYPELLQAQEAGARISSETTLFFELCRAPIIGITGSSGKTTTTTLVGLILEEDDRKVLVGGNIGVPLIEKVEGISPDTIVVMELSSFQLQLLRASPHIGAVLNLTPNHLDIHGSMEEYADAKKNIYRHQRAGDFAVFNLDDPSTRQMGSDCPDRAMYFSATGELREGAYLAGDELRVRLEGMEASICRAGELKLRGRHNFENALAAALIAGLAGARPESARAVLTRFKGVPHRLEPVRELGGVSYYNDSIATSPERARAALRSFDGPIVLIAGGYDKHLPFDGFAREAVQRTRAVITIGATAPKIENALEAEMARQGKQVSVLRARDLAEAVQTARRVAQPGDVVLLSPACASYDMFSDYEERGESFRRLVRALE